MQLTEEAPPASEEAPQLTLPPGVRIKKPVRPDDTELKTQTNLLHEEIKKKKVRIEAISQLIADKKAGRGEGSKEQQAIKSKLAELKNQFQSHLGQKQSLRTQLESAKKTREAVRTSLRELKNNLKFTTVEAIDERIAELEERVNHSSLSLNEEKRILEDIKKLKQSRATVGQYSDKLAQLAQDESATDELMARLKAADEELNKIKTQEEGLRGQLAELREKEAEKSSDIPSLIQEKDECREVCKQAYEKIQELRGEHQAKWEEYKEQQALWNLQWQEDKKKKQEAYLAERARRDEERAARMAELAGDPFSKELTMCEQVINYLSKYVASEAAAVEEKKADLSAPEGFALMQRKKEDEQDAWMLGKGVGGKKGVKGKAKSKGVPAAGSSDEKLVHSLDILEAFAQLKLEVPLTKSRVPPLLDEVRGKKEYFLEKQQRVKENGAAALQPEEGATAADGAEADATAAAPAAGSGKGSRKNGRQEALNLDEENFPSIGGRAAAAAPAAEQAEAADAAGGEPDEVEADEQQPLEEVEEEATAADEAGDAASEREAATEAAEGGAAADSAPALSKAGEVSVSLTVSDEDGESVTLAIQAN